MTFSKLGSLTLTGVIAFCCVPGCGDDDSEDSPFDGTSGSSGSGGSGGKGGTTSRAGGAGEAPDSGGSAGEAPDSGGSGSAGESSLGGSAGSEQGGSSQAGGGGEPSGSGGSANPGVGWYCNFSATGCICVQEPLEVGDCGVFNCCYTYDSGVAGLACACNNAMDAACNAEVANYDGTRVDFCPP